MSDQPPAASGSTPTTPVYSERQWAPLWWWPAGLGIITLLAATLHMGAPGVQSWLPYAVLLPIATWVLLWMGRNRVEVVSDADGTLELRTGKAHLPVTYVARAAAVPVSAKSAALGRQLDPAAYVQHRPWIGPMVLLVLDDPDDPTPYWLISTRRPEKVLAALGVPSAR
ncbi:DUF3093 domain-containing protein [Nocardia terpenica]|uniref:DUF3093 domain-containing protein n=1 Tax=Nocardia terpenica TaxID=455432 RepID=A0A164P4F5_9NOCA|nr:DUF3093 domain-containing protein [Nocardia terpenica]ATL68872.1 DUF3093 domain-containing protein [Nocardia terpenica]KZM75103.1 hypothetical protein AWN90_24330 [Nocardia terpenica]MBF6065528.1 DUF3093 domain-containing protein [Nocardia terpenica]MBF6108670.1 DUF3093 domain-containing protein [Nocardia terpenica]MBF6115700.1 DUF3093 domain-containing protein [Nocardia terpenica]